ncbi:hypothetical protein C8Q70DRAFT_610847 [Cubamyces menziesii]|nr:hypothetical protein C8Q70DRAFT_610847 [Cubamyces menziesii]
MVATISAKLVYAFLSLSKARLVPISYLASDCSFDWPLHAQTVWRQPDHVKRCCLISILASLRSRERKPRTCECREPLVLRRRCHRSLVTTHVNMVCSRGHCHRSVCFYKPGLFDKDAFLQRNNVNPASWLKSMRLDIYRVGMMS